MIVKQPEFENLRKWGSQEAEIKIGKILVRKIVKRSKKQKLWSKMAQNSKLQKTVQNGCNIT